AEESAGLANVDRPIEVEHVRTASVSLPATPIRPGESSPDWQERHFAATTPRIDALLERLRAMPEIEHVALTDAVPLSGRSNTNSSVTVIGREYPGGEQAMPLTARRFVSADYFQTLGLGVLRGRAFTPHDSHEPGVSAECV